MPTWVVRLNCEYSLEVEADTADEAMAEAEKLDVAEWEQAWSPIEAEEEE